MESGFNFELYQMVFKNCFICSSYYKNGNIRLSLFGCNPETEHFADISLEQNKKLLKKDEIVVDTKFKPTMVTQLVNLGILKKQTGICVVNDSIYPIYTINLIKIAANEYYMQELIAA